MTATEPVAPRLARRSALGPLAAELARRCSGPAFAAAEDGFRALTELRAAPSGVASLEAALGLSLPPLRRAAPYDGGWVVTLGPGWWLVDAPDGTPPPAGSPGVSAVDVSAQRIAVALMGPAVRDVLAGGCSLDLHPDAFAVGDAASTPLAKAGVVVLRTDQDAYRLWVRASFARYLAAWLLDASSLVEPSQMVP